MVNITLNYPLQFIKKPTAKDSRLVMPHSFAAAVQPTILPKQARKITRITYPQTGPESNNPICVFSPDKVKYY
jgi:hypothetical protein